LEKIPEANLRVGKTILGGAAPPKFFFTVQKKINYV